MSKVISIENLHYRYPESDELSFGPITVNIEQGDFIVVIGSSGSGKSTLLRAVSGLIPHFHGGSIGGIVEVLGKNTFNTRPADLAKSVGIVFQEPERQLVCTSVKGEIAFGVENMGLKPEVISRRVEEMIDVFGLSQIRDAFIPTLSGGEKQRTLLASIMAAHPEILLLDEPTSQLDPVASEDFLTAVRRISEELGTTIIMSEQRLERCLHAASRVMVLKEGKIHFDGSPSEYISSNISETELLPPVSRIFKNACYSELPLTVREGKALIRGAVSNGDYSQPEENECGARESDLIVEMRNVWFRYENSVDWALKNVDLKIYSGEIIAVMGANGSGKSTLIKIAVGLLKQEKGQITGSSNHLGRLSYVPQNPSAVFIEKKGHDELKRGLAAAQKSGNADGRIEKELKAYGITHISEKHSSDISVGERQRLALAIATVTDPKAVFLDEPTRGMDSKCKRLLEQRLREISEEGGAVMLATHDVELASRIASRVIIMGNGSVVVNEKSRRALGEALFYAPQASRLFNGINETVFDEESAIEALRGMNKMNCGVEA